MFLEPLRQTAVGFSLLLVSQDKQCFFFSATQRTDHEVAHFSWTSFAALFIMAKLVEKIIFFLELRSPYRVWFMMAWYFEPERQKLRWCLKNMIYTIIDTHYTRCEHSIIFYTFSVARSASYYLLQQGWIFLQLAIFMSLNLSITSAKYWVKITALTCWVVTDPW